MKPSIIKLFALIIFVGLVTGCGSNSDPAPVVTPQHLVKTINRTISTGATQSTSQTDYTYTNCLLTKLNYTENVTGSATYTTTYAYTYTYDAEGYLTRDDYTYSYSGSGGNNNSTAFATYEYSTVATEKRLTKTIKGGSQISTTTTSYQYDANGKISQVVASTPAISSNVRPLLVVTTSTYTNGILTGYSDNSDNVVTQPWTIQNGLVTRRNSSTPNYYTTAEYDANGRETVYESWYNGNRTSRVETAYAASGIDPSYIKFKGHPDLRTITNGASTLTTKKTYFNVNGFRLQEFLYTYTLDSQQFVSVIANTTNNYTNNALSGSYNGQTTYTYVDCQ